MCALSTHDSVLTIFDGNACLPSTELACDDDGCGVGGGPSVIQSVPVLNAHHYLIRVAEFGGGPGEQGGFTISRIGGDCPNACPCDWNHDNALNSQDFFDFLNSFFAGNADFNHDNITNSQDFFDFLNCFFAGCH
jgi:hypothetical protein